MILAWNYDDTLQPPLYQTSGAWTYIAALPADVAAIGLRANVFGGDGARRDVYGVSGQRAGAFGVDGARRDCLGQSVRTP